MKKPTCPSCQYFREAQTQHYEGYCTRNEKLIPIHKDFLHKACNNFVSPEGVTYQDVMRYDFDIITLAKLSKSGVGDLEVAKRVCVSPDTVKYHRLRLGIRRAPGPRKKIDDQKLKKLFEKGYTYSEIAKNFGCALITVQQHLSKLGLSGLRRKKMLAEREAKRSEKRARVYKLFKARKGVATYEEIRIEGLLKTVKELQHKGKVGVLRLYLGRRGSHKYTSHERFGPYAERTIFYISGESLGRWLAKNVPPLPGTVNVLRNLGVPKEAVEVYQGESAGGTGE